MPQCFMPFGERRWQTQSLGCLSAFAQPSLTIVPHHALPENPGGMLIPVGVPGAAEVTACIAVWQCWVRPGSGVWGSEAAAPRVKDRESTRLATLLGSVGCMLSSCRESE